MGLSYDLTIKSKSYPWYTTFPCAFKVYVHDFASIFLTFCVYLWVRAFLCNYSSVCIFLPFLCFFMGMCEHVFTCLFPSHPCLCATSSICDHESPSQFLSSIYSCAYTCIHAVMMHIFVFLYHTGCVHPYISCLLYYWCFIYACSKKIGNSISLATGPLLSGETIKNRFCAFLNQELVGASCIYLHFTWL